MAEVDTKKLGRILNNCGLLVRKQDGKVLLYNSSQKFLSKGVLVENLAVAELLALQYLKFLQQDRFVPITDFAQDHQYRPVSFQEVPNRVDEQSAYYINKTAMSSVSRINLLKAAKALKVQVESSVLARSVSEKLTSTDIRRQKKLKAAVAEQFDLPMKRSAAVDRFTSFADEVSLRYCGSPVYLVGGALSDPDPRDLDVVVVLPDALFREAYGGTESEWAAGFNNKNPARVWQRWAKDCAKQSKTLTTLIGGPIVDFKVQPESWANEHYGSFPKQQLSNL